MIHEADPQSRPVAIIVCEHVVRTSVPNFQNKTMFVTGKAAGLAEWIFDDTCLVFLFHFQTRSTSSEPAWSAILPNLHFASSSTSPLNLPEIPRTSSNVLEDDSGAKK